jgi:hypothetical protein
MPTLPGADGKYAIYDIINNKRLYYMNEKHHGINNMIIASFLATIDSIRVRIKRGEKFNDVDMKFYDTLKECCLRLYSNRPKHERFRMFVENLEMERRSLLRTICKCEGIQFPRKWEENYYITLNDVTARVKSYLYPLKNDPGYEDLVNVKIYIDMANMGYVPKRLDHEIIEDKFNKRIRSS